MTWLFIILMVSLIILIVYEVTDYLPMPVKWNDFDEGGCWWRKKIVMRKTFKNKHSSEEMVKISWVEYFKQPY